MISFGWIGTCIRFVPCIFRITGQAISAQKIRPEKFSFPMMSFHQPVYMFYLTHYNSCFFLSSCQSESVSFTHQIVFRNPLEYCEGQFRRETLHFVLLLLYFLTVFQRRSSNVRFRVMNLLKQVLVLFMGGQDWIYSQWWFFFEVKSDLKTIFPKKRLPQLIRIAFTSLFNLYGLAQSNVLNFTQHCHSDWRRGKGFFLFNLKS